MPNLHEDVIALLEGLVAIESFSGHEENAQAYILNWFARHGIPARLEAADGGLANVVVEVDGQPGGPTLWLGGHCDTVGIASNWTRNPHEPLIEDGRLYGLGSMDMKGGLAAAMVVARELHACRETWHGRLIFSALADEEAFSRGANAFVRTERGIDAAIMCEPHFDDVVIGAMGKVNLHVEVFGRSAHASRPEEGLNAVVEASRLIAAIGDLERKPHPQFGAGTHCVLDIRSGDGAYELSVPAHCRFIINWQLMPGETDEEAVATIHRLSDEANVKARVEIKITEPRYESFWLSKEHPFVVAFAQSYRRELGREPDLVFGRGVSDANVFSGRAGIPTLLFGPNGANMHSGDEWVDLAQLCKATDLYRAFALDFLKSHTKDR